MTATQESLSAVDLDVLREVKQRGHLAYYDETLYRERRFYSDKEHESAVRRLNALNLVQMDTHQLFPGDPSIMETTCVLTEDGEELLRGLPN